MARYAPPIIRNGSRWQGDSGNPASGVGLDGDYYLNLTNGAVWEKTGGTWVDTGLVIKGADGADGADGTNGADGADLTGRVITAGAGLTGGGDLSADRTLAADIAVAADIRGKAASHLLDVPGIYAASAPVTLTDAATIAVDLNTGIHFTVTLGGNRTLGNPTNATVGQSGLIRVVQDGTGSRTLALSSDWEIAGGSAPELSSNANAVDLFSYLVYASGVVYLFQIGKDFS